MSAARTFAELRLVNGSTGDPALFIDFPGKDNALLFDAGDLCRLDAGRLGDLQAVFLTHHHMDHFVGFDRLLRANLDRDKLLHVFGPADTIRRVYARVTSYEHPYFAFQKLVLQVHEVWPDRTRVALLECAKHFPEPNVTEAAWNGPVIYENEDLKVEAAHADHSVPCLSFALVRGNGGRIAYIADTAWSEAARPGLLRLSDRASRLYCDSYYAQAEARQAATYHHMTATHAAEAAAAAQVDELVLIHFAPRYAGRYADLLDEAKAVFPRTTAEFVEPPAASGGVPHVPVRE